MASTKKMNVLVYSGTGTTASSLQHTLYTLRRLLNPNYAIIPITAPVLIKEPWTASCALLVFPGGADLGYCRALNGEGNRRIEQYVRRGGSYLGLCAGGYYGTARCEFEVADREMEVVGSRELAFFPGTCRGAAFKGFKYGSEAGAKAAALKVNGEAFKGVDLNGAGEREEGSKRKVPERFRSYYNGGGVFVDALKFEEEGVEVLAGYTDQMDVDGGDEKKGAAAVVYCRVGEGNVILTGPHPEFAAINLDRSSPSGPPDYASIVDAIQADDVPRATFLQACLTKLGLTVAKEISSIPPLSHLHLTSIHHTEVDELLQELKENEVITIDDLGDGEEYIRGENDTFRVEKQSHDGNGEGGRWGVAKLLNSLSEAVAGVGKPSPNGSSQNPTLLSAKNKPEETESGSRTPTTPTTEEGIIDYNTVIKPLLPHPQAWPSTRETPHFNHHLYYTSLRRYQQQERDMDDATFGTHLLYGEVVTSTNTILEKNPKLLSHLPQGFTATATTQIAGRGRGSNVWVSPAGSLIFSVCIKHPMHLSNIAPVTFVQYIAAIAIVEGIHSYDSDGFRTKSGYAKVPVRLKWPNDIYADDPSNPGTLTKIGGILVNSSYTPSTGCYDLVIGIGINTINPHPTTSLNALLSHPDVLASPSSTSRSTSSATPTTPAQPLPAFSREKLLARLLTSFEHLYTHFCRKGFDSYLEELYYKHWIHSGQVVTLETEGGVKARILGVSRDWGMLRVRELVDGHGDGRGGGFAREGRIWELQSDSNSFDFFKGLVKRKV